MEHLRNRVLAPIEIAEADGPSTSAWRLTDAVQHLGPSLITSYKSHSFLCRGEASAGGSATAIMYDCKQLSNAGQCQVTRMSSIAIRVQGCNVQTGCKSYASFETRFCLPSTPLKYMMI